MESTSSSTSSWEKRITFQPHASIISCRFSSLAIDVVVIASVYLHHQTFCNTRKVSEERLEGIVAAKLEAAPASTTQVVPEQRFRFCLAHAQIMSVGGCFRVLAVCHESRLWSYLGR